MIDDDDRRLIASTRREVDAALVDEVVDETVDVVPASVRRLIEQYPRPWRLGSDFIIDGEGNTIIQTRWSIAEPLAALIVQAVNAFDMERQWKVTDP